jgi:hypothetical protein
MANALYDPGREGFLLAEIDWDTAVIKSSLTRSGSFTASHKFVNDFTTAGGSLVVTSSALTSKTGTSGIADAADVTFTAVSAGAALTAVLLFQASAVTGGADVAASAQRLIAWLDTTGSGAFSITPNGGDITIVWDNGTNKIFKL